MSDINQIALKPSPVDNENVFGIIPRADTKRILPDSVYAKYVRYIHKSEITAEMVDMFLQELAKTGQRRVAAARVGLSKDQIYSLAKADDEFKHMVEEHEAMFVDKVVGEAHRRGVEGWDEEVYSQKTGKQMGTVRKYDSNMLQLLLKKHDPSYNDKRVSEVNITGGIVIIPATGSATTPEQWSDQFNANPAEAESQQQAVVKAVVSKVIEQATGLPVKTEDTTQ